MRYNYKLNNLWSFDHKYFIKGIKEEEFSTIHMGFLMFKPHAGKRYFSTKNGWIYEVKNENLEEFNSHVCAWIYAKTLCNEEK